MAGAAIGGNPDWGMPYAPGGMYVGSLLSIWTVVGLLSGFGQVPRCGGYPAQTKPPRMQLLPIAVI